MKTLGVAQTYPLFEKSGAKTFIENRGSRVFKRVKGGSPLWGVGAKPQGLVLCFYE